MKKIDTLIWFDVKLIIAPPFGKKMTRFRAVRTSVVTVKDNATAIAL